MRAFSCILAAGWLMLSAVSLTFGADPVRWEANFETALQKAAQQNRPVLLHFWNDGCPPCEIVERYVFPHPQVSQAINANFVAVKVHAGQRADLAQRYGVYKWPTDVILTPTGQKVAQHVSPQDPRQFSDAVQQLAAREQSRMAPAGNLAQAPNNHPLGGANATGRASYEAQAGGEFPLNGNRGYAPPSGQNDYASAFRGGAAPPPPYANRFSPNASPYGGLGAQGEQDPARASVFPGASQTAGPGGPMNSAYPGGGMNNSPMGAPIAAAPPPPARQGPAPQALSQDRPQGAAQVNPFATPPTGNAPAQVGQPSLGQSTFGQSTFGQSTFGQSTIGQSTIGQSTISQAPLGQSPAIGQTGNNVPPAQQAGPAPSAAPQAPQFALDGCCVVSLVEQLHLPLEQQTWTKGDPRWGAVHRGQTYLFAGPEQQQKFLANPDYYTPFLSGHDPVAFVEQGQLVSGRREFGFTHQGRIYMFASEQNLQRFWNSHDVYMNRVHQAMNASANQQRR